MATGNAPITLSPRCTGWKQLPPIQPYVQVVAQSSPHSPMSRVSQEFVSICRETELKFIAALALDKLGALASPTEAAQVAGAIATELFPSPSSSTDGSNATISAALTTDMEPRSSSSSSSSSSRHCYATDSALQEAVDVLCEQLVKRCQGCPLPHGEADAVLRCSKLEQEISRLEALAADRTLTHAERLAAEQHLDALKERKCYELDLICTLMEQEDAAGELTSGGTAVFEKSWGVMMKLEGRARELKKQLADKHAARLVLQQFPRDAADEVLLLAAAHDASHGHYRAWAWKMMQRVHAELVQGKHQLVKGLKKSSSVPSRLLAMQISHSRKCKSSSTAVNAVAKA